MNTITYTELPEDAKNIRIEIFMKEQGFKNEFDDIDSIAKHIVCYENKKPIGTCRFFLEEGHYTIGRVAVLKEYRNQHIGHYLLKAAQKEIKELGGTTIIVHAQKQAELFYAKLGYKQFGQIDYDEGCPHVWMKLEYPNHLI